MTGTTVQKVGIKRKRIKISADLRKAENALYYTYQQT